MQTNIVVGLPVSWRTVPSLDSASLHVTEEAHQTYWHGGVEISGASNTRTQVSVGVKNIEEVFSGNPDEAAGTVGVSDETRSRHLPSTSQKRSLVKSCLIQGGPKV